jgi:formylglycine-generating enzyme required for sulfatase activity
MMSSSDDASKRASSDPEATRLPPGDDPARPVGRRERGWGWRGRNPVAAGLAAILTLATVLGMAGIVWKYKEVEQQKAVAEQQKRIAEGKEKEALRQADKAKKASDFLVSIFTLSDVNGQRGTMTVRQILDAAEKRVQREFADQPEQRAELLAAIETVYAKITASSPLAMILEVSGGVQLQTSRTPTPRPVPQTLLYAGDLLTLASDGQVQLLVLSDLHKERLKAGREARVRRKGCEPADAIRERSEDVMMTFVHLPRGTFYRGWDGDKKGVRTEIKEDFEIAVHAVTQSQWQAVMGENPSGFSRFNAHRNDVKNISEEELKLFPVENVSWDDAQNFIKKLNEQNRGSGHVYRLPTGLEWEYACRGGATSEEECSYHFYFAKPTNDLSSDQANFDGGHPFGNAPEGKRLRRPTRVGAYPPNKLGLCDMQGNVWQWCADSEGAGRVIRGGAWSSDGEKCRAAYRNSLAASFRSSDSGLRLARVPVR